MEYSAVFVDAFHVYAQLFKEYVEFAVECERLVGGPSVEEVAHLLEYPRPSESGASHHHRIHAVLVESVACLLRRADVAVAYDGYVYAWVLLHLSYQGPVGVARVHLCSCPSVYGEGLYAAVL